MRWTSLGIPLALTLIGAGFSYEQRVRQVEKQARLTREAAARFSEAARLSADAGRPQALAVLEAEQEAIGAALDRLEQRLAELEGAE
ncbi:MAG: hypothetical protein H6739_33315 [Alphaproteobacteria bacterium]|nr:hypothetical protein [Alphaproteobacteria bacterium]